MRKKSRNKKYPKNIKDYHHILFQKRYWHYGWAKLLREYPYCGDYIPKDTLHKELHSQIHNVPTPKGEDCKEAFEKIKRLLGENKISLGDCLEDKIKTLISCFEGKCPATIEALECQLQVVEKFYGRR